MPNMNVNTFLGLGVEPANAAVPSTVPADAEPSEIVCCCMFGNRHSLYTAFAVWFACSAIVTGCLLLFAYIFEMSLVIVGSVGAGLACVVLLYAVWYNRAGKQTAISKAAV